MSIQEIIEFLEMIERTIPNYSEGRRYGYEDGEIEYLVDRALAEGIGKLYELQEIIEIIGG